MPSMTSRRAGRAVAELACSGLLGHPDHPGADEPGRSAGRPAFSWNHGERLREGGLSLGRRLGADVTFPDASSRGDGPAGRTAVVAAVAALGLAGVLGVRGRRQRTAAR